MKNYFGFTKEQYNFLKSLNSPAKIQDFLDKLPYNLEEHGETCYSPRRVLELRTANCIEGAIFSAAALQVNGFKPLILDLVAAPGKDDDHVLAVFKVNGCWGAIGKSKFIGLKFRDPVYRSARELVMSYFKDYFNEKGEKTLREYSKPVDLSRFNKKNWMTSEKHVWFIPNYLCKIKHTKISQKRLRLRKVDPLSLKAAMLGYPKKTKKSK